MRPGSQRLVVDEKLFLSAIRLLADLEEGGTSFELLNAVSEFSKAPYISSRFKGAVGREMNDDDRRAIDYYVGAVYLVYHHKANIESLDELFADLAEPAADFIRIAAWAFLTAWNFRYGGFFTDLVARNTLVDPSLRP